MTGPVGPPMGVRFGHLIVVFACLASACGVGAGRTDVDAQIEVFGPYQGVDADRFGEVLDAFEEATGIAVRFVGSSDFVSDLTRRVGETKNPPDVAIVPQAGVISELAAADQLTPLQPAVEEVVLDNFEGSGTVLSEADEASYAIPFRLTMKSLVWYRPDVFEENGWSVPTSLDELTALVEEIDAQAPIAPWCFGIEAGTATGWAATDWTEDLVLRRSGLETYESWAAGEVPFADPEIADAFDEFRMLVLAPGRVEGGVSGVLETPVAHVVDPLFADPAECALYKQADFAVGWMPEGTSIGPDGDVDFFVLPGVDAAEPPPVLLGGDQIVQFASSPEIDRLLMYLAGPEAAEVWVRKGGFISANPFVPGEAYPEDYLRALIEALGEAPTLVYDASDQMPPEIGSGLLWREITRWVAGGEDYPVFAETIDSARAAVDEESGAADLAGEEDS